MFEFKFLLNLRKHKIVSSSPQVRGKSRILFYVAEIRMYIMTPSIAHVIHVFLIINDLCKIILNTLNKNWWPNKNGCLLMLWWSMILLFIL